MEVEASPSFGNSALTGGSSALAKELRQIKRDRRSHLMNVPEIAIITWDAIVTIIVRLSDENAKHSSWEDRVRSAFEEAFQIPASEENVVAELERFTTYMESSGNEALSLLVKRLKRPSFISFLRRVLGAALFDRLHSAFQRDVSVTIEGLRKAAKAVMPLALAFEDLAECLTPQQLKEITSLGISERTLLSAVLKVDKALENTLESTLLANLTSAPEGEMESVESSNLDVVVSEIRLVISGRSRAALEKLNNSLTRKIQGARDALTYSADPVSQAATSLIELIDRLLRDAFSEDDVLAWLRLRYADSKNLVYIDKQTGKTRPTKKAQALCFTYAGVQPPDTSPFHELAAAAIVATRSQLQQLKHADAGTPEEALELSRFLSAIEGYLLFAVGVGWARASTPAIEKFESKVNQVEVGTDRAE